MCKHIRQSKFGCPVENEIFLSFFLWLLKMFLVAPFDCQSNVICTHRNCLRIISCSSRRQQHRSFLWFLCEYFVATRFVCPGRTLSIGWAQQRPIRFISRFSFIHFVSFFCGRKLKSVVDCDISTLISNWKFRSSFMLVTRARVPSTKDEEVHSCFVVG